MKKRLFAISALLFLLAPALLTFCWLKMEKKAVKREIKWKIAEGIDRQELVLLKFTSAKENADVRWEHSKEFEYKNEMYDVVESKTMGDTTYYWCWWDYEETRLNRKLAVLVNEAFNANPEKKERQNNLLSFYKTLFFHYPVKALNQTKKEVSITYGIYRYTVLLRFNPPPTPPPEYS